GDKGATLKQPWLETGSMPSPAAPPAAGSQTPNYIQTLLNQTGAAAPAVANPAGPSSLLPYDTTSINNDVVVTKELGPWMVLIISYAGPEGPMRARKMVAELRTTYKLPAFVFNYGREEKLKELERIKEQIDKQKAALQQAQQATGLTVEQPIHVRHTKIDEH